MVGPAGHSPATFRLKAEYSKLELRSLNLLTGQDSNLRRGMITLPVNSRTPATTRLPANIVPGKLLPKTFYPAPRSPRKVSNSIVKERGLEKA